jgi:hypothetical protein
MTAAELNAARRRADGATERPPQLVVPQLRPFAVDPLFMGRLNSANISTATVAIGMAAVMALAVLSSAAFARLLLRPKDAPALWMDVWLFVTRKSAAEPGHTLPLLRDYPSIVLTFTVVAAVSLVYGLYRIAARFHGEMEAAGSITYNDAGAVALTVAVQRLNRKYERWGRVSALVFVLALAFMVATNVGLRSGLFSFVGPNLYEQWWASLYPFRLGGLVWVLFGAIGIYAVYAEAVLGITYVNFLRRLRPHYQFRANLLNIDGFFGWQALREVFTNLQLGALCTFVSSWAFSFFLETALGAVGMTAFITLFIGIVTYVYFSVNLSFRRQVQRDKKVQAEQVAREITALTGRTGCESQLALLVAFRRLDYIAQIPSTPIRQRWFLAGALSLLGSFSATVAELLPYLAFIQLF